MSTRAILDYDATIQVGARVQCVRSSRIGWVIDITSRCHWNCNEWADQWRPRAAYVLFDESRPPRDPRGEDVNHLTAGDWTGSYVAPEHLAAVPAHWHMPSGALVPVAVARSWGAFQPFVIRQNRHEWWAMNREDRGFGSFGFVYASWSEAAIAHGAEVYGTGRDGHSWFVRARPVIRHSTR